MKNISYSPHEPTDAAPCPTRSHTSGGNANPLSKWLMPVALLALLLVEVGTAWGQDPTAPVTPVGPGVTPPVVTPPVVDPPVVTPPVVDPPVVDPPVVDPPVVDPPVVTPPVVTPPVVTPPVVTPPVVTPPPGGGPPITGTNGTGRQKSARELYREGRTPSGALKAIIPTRATASDQSPANRTNPRMALRLGLAGGGGGNSTNVVANGGALPAPIAPPLGN